MIAALSSSFLTGVESNRAVPAPVQAQAQTQLASGVPFVSDAELETALDEARVPPRATEAIVEENETSRLVGLRTALAVLAIFSLVALFLTGQIPPARRARRRLPSRPSRHDADHRRGRGAAAGPLQVSSVTFAPAERPPARPSWAPRRSGRSRSPT